MSSANPKLSDFFVRLPKCEDSGTNWSIYKSRFQFAADAAGLGDHLKETHLPPVPPTQPALADVQAAHDRAVKEYTSGQAIIKQAIASTIPDTLFLRFMGSNT